MGNKWSPKSLAVDMGWRMVRVMSALATEEVVTEEVADTENWADDLWTRPEPDAERIARYRLHDPDEPSHYVRHSAHLPRLTPELEESGYFWMRLLRRASTSH